MKRKLFFILSLLGLLHQANAQLFTKYAVGLSGLGERGIRSPRAVYNETPMVYGGNVLVLTEDNIERVFATLGMGLTNYIGKEVSIAPEVLDPMALGQALPKSTSISSYNITHLNFPLSIGYKFINKKKISVYASVGVDFRFKVASKSNYMVKDSTQKIIYERTDTHLPYLKKQQLFALSVGMEYKSQSGRFIYRIEPFLKVDSRKFFKSEDRWLAEFLTYAGVQVSCFYQLKLKN